MARSDWNERELYNPKYWKCMWDCCPPRDEFRADMIRDMPESVRVPFMRLVGPIPASIRALVPELPPDPGPLPYRGLPPAAHAKALGGAIVRGIDAVLTFFIFPKVDWLHDDEEQKKK